jgi:uncharacterized protein YecE (DUF72 family)
VVGVAVAAPVIRVGIGGWTYEPWRGVFYPEGLKHAEELSYASRKLTAIEINATFYRTQSPQSFRRWAAETPDDFVFSVKAPRTATHRKILAEAGSSIERFLDSGITELGKKLGPILWQLPPWAPFHAEDFAAFLKLLPKTRNARALRHAVEVRHKSFATQAFIELLRAHQVAVAFIDSDKHPPLPDLTTDFVYARLEHTIKDEPTGYPPAALDQWVTRIKQWEKGAAPSDLPALAAPAPAGPRDCFIYFISGAKEKAPLAAMALLQRLEDKGQNTKATDKPQSAAS